MSEGLKYDEQKADWSLVPLYFVEDLVSVFQHGLKYGYENWRKDFGPDYQRRFIAAMKRHLLEVEKNGPLDINTDDGNVYHLAQIAWNSLTLLYHAKRLSQEIPQPGSQRYTEIHTALSPEEVQQISSDAAA